MRSRLILSGTVQGVGFRAIVKQYAQYAKIKGRVRNLEDGTVEIYCEYKDLEQLTNFKDSLIKIDAASGLKVDSIEQFEEGSEQYGKIEEKYFKTFSVYYGDNLTDYEIDQAERSEFTVFYGMKMFSSMNDGFSNLSDKMDNLGNKIDNVGNKIDNVSNKIDKLGEDLGNKIDNVSNKIDKLGEDLGNKVDNVSNKIDKLGEDLGNKIDNVGEKTDSMHTDMNKSFEVLDVKYGTIGEAMVKLLEQQQEHNKKLDDILKALTEKK
ncbi:MAG: acylphosphatase [Thermoplasmata archaeon]